MSKKVICSIFGDLEPEFALMSRGGRGKDNLGGLGKRWWKENAEDMRKHDSIIINGREVRPPKYYDRLYEAVDPIGLKCKKVKRMLAKKRINRVRQCYV